MILIESKGGGERENRGGWRGTTLVKKSERGIALRTQCCAPASAVDHLVRHSPHLPPSPSHFSFL